MTFGKLKLHSKLNPDFDRFVLSTFADHNSRGQQRRHNPGKARIQILRTEANDFHKIASMVPDGLPPHVRDDIAQSILLALMEGTLRRDQVRARVQPFVKDHNRMFPTKFAKFGDSPLYSLDEVLFDDSTTTRGDNVSEGLWGPPG